MIATVYLGSVKIPIAIRTTEMPQDFRPGPVVGPCQVGHEGVGNAFDIISEFGILLHSSGH